jgi:hypothetical protein
MAAEELSHFAYNAYYRREKVIITVLNTPWEPQARKLASNEWVNCRMIIRDGLVLAQNQAQLQKSY